MLSVNNLRKDYPTEHGDRTVLRDVNFALNRGERMAVLGRNGAGKSTLMRIIGGVEHQTSGTIRSSMTLSWPLGLGGGFQGSLTGLDNLKFIARLYNCNYRDVYDYVEDFSELGKYLAEPVKTYSSGMRARLAFGLSLAVDFDCYLIDEVIFVGDARFHRRCQEEIFEKRGDRALILISHDPWILQEYCNMALVLHDGYAKTFRDPALAIRIYNDL